MLLIIFKAISLFALGTFFYFGYDMKKRSDWKNLAPSKSTSIMKIVAICLALVLIATVFLLESIMLYDYISLSLFILGATLVKLAKSELEKNNAFTWTGYVLEKPNLVTSGIYAFIRHPLYTGVYLTEIGGILIVLTRTDHLIPGYGAIINFILVGILLYAMFFNSILAKKESENLEHIFGNKYKEYSKNVHAFIPKIFR